jgi:hypothetical protein
MLRRVILTVSILGLLGSLCMWWGNALWLTVIPSSGVPVLEVHDGCVCVFWRQPPPELTVDSDRPGTAWFSGEEGNYTAVTPGVGLRNVYSRFRPAAGWRLPAWSTQGGVITRVVVPFWLLSAVFSVYPVIQFVGLPIRRWNRRRRGLCSRCGYNLTGCPGNCPECGCARSDLGRKGGVLA